MKKFLIPAVLFIALTTSAFADGKKSNTQLLNELTSALKTVNASAWKNTESYAKASFTVNGKNVSAFLNSETGSLIGFSMAIDEKSLPEGATANIAKKYQGWNVVNPIMFLTKEGQIDYYVQVVKNGKSLALKVYGNGMISIYARMNQ